ncbi:unnamed protein product [Haemonchus placei]|uniref:Aa_trans domain-containing protein n=1 Tax=Haemonchus placei TaxID=6290 RepID=A0A0N4WI28_HAEPC|nr:unnamed protein product [Haemonchus placei]
MPSAAIDEGPSERYLSSKDESKEDVQQYEESPKPAHAQRDDGYSQKEKFLFGLTAVLPILVGASFIGLYDMTVASIIFALAASVVLGIGVVGVCTKNSTCMLISIILLSPLIRSDQYSPVNVYIFGLHYGIREYADIQVYASRDGSGNNWPEYMKVLLSSGE